MIILPRQARDKHRENPFKKEHYVPFMQSFQLCKYLRTGLCPRGIGCPFAHGAIELKNWSKARRKERQMRAKSLMSSLADAGDCSEDDGAKNRGRVGVVI
jgi:hypothetical protein